MREQSSWSQENTPFATPAELPPNFARSMSQAQNSRPEKCAFLMKVGSTMPAHYRPQADYPGKHNYRARPSEETTLHHASQNTFRMSLPRHSIFFARSATPNFNLSPSEADGQRPRSIAKPFRTRPDLDQKNAFAFTEWQLVDRKIATIAPQPYCPRPSIAIFFSSAINLAQPRWVPFVSAVNREPWRCQFDLAA
jgi:hypothetical protein